MQEHEVVIVGGGPTGMMLAAELALAKVDVALVERRASADVESSRAGGLHARTLEVLDQRGVAERFLREGQTMQIVHMAGVALDLADFPTRHPYGLALWQKHIERILASWIEELPITVHRGREVTGVAQDDAGVDVTLADGSLRARYVVGCDGGCGLVRGQVGIELEGWDASTSYLIAEAEVVDEPAWGLRRGEHGVNGIGKLDDGKRMRIVSCERSLRHGEPSMRELREALMDVWGSDFGLRDASWISRFTDRAMQANAYRAGRVLLAGDAAHVHSPVGGQGLNTGVQDAVNLGWKLARVVHGTSADTLLDSYHAERHPVGARVLRTTMALTALERGDARSTALREMVAETLGFDEVRRHHAGRLSGLDIRYDFGEGHPLLGRRMPDLELATREGTTRVSTLLHTARPLLIDFAASLGADAIDARFDGAWELPVVGRVVAPSAVLVRPDGHVAWVGQGSREGLEEARVRWFS